jgi:hypothetical protein
MKMYLYEGLNKQDSHSMMLWESAGRKLVEAQLTADQITQLFQQIEQGATAAGGNRTGLGLTKDAGTAVMKAYNDLKSKVANSGPVKGIDALYDQAAEKLKQATGGDQGAMAYVQKYRDFAKKHPVAQSLIYGALIAAAGISGAGAGGAAALGLFKMVDKLLQGEKFSSAAYSGAKTGAMAYAAGQIGKAVRGGDQAQQAVGAVGGDQAEMSKYLLKYYTPTDFDYVPNGTDVSVISKATGQLVYQFDAGEMMLPPDEFIANIGRFGKPASSAVSQAARDAADAAFNAAHPNFESRNLSHKQVLALFEHIVIAQKLSIQLQEGIWDDIKSGTGKTLGQVAGVAGKAAGATTQQVSKGIKAGAGAVGSALGKGVQAVAQKAQQVGHNLTTKTTADKLQSAWKAAGSPTDSEAIVDLLTAQGIDKSVIAGAMKAVAPFASVDRSRLPDVSKLNLQQKQQLLKQLDAIEQGQQPTAAPAAIKVPGTATLSAPGDPVTQPTSAPKVIGVPSDARPIAVPGGGATGLTVPGVSNTTATPPPTTPGGGSPAKKPKVSYSDIQPKVTGTVGKVSPARNSGTPTQDEYDKFQQKVQAAMKKQA